MVLMPIGGKRWTVSVPVHAVSCRLLLALATTCCSGNGPRVDLASQPDTVGPPRREGGWPEGGKPDLDRLDVLKLDALKPDKLKPDAPKKDGSATCPPKNPLNGNYYVFEGTYKGWCLFTDPNADAFSAFCPATNQALYSNDVVDLRDQIDKKGICQ